MYRGVFACLLAGILAFTPFSRAENPDKGKTLALVSARAVESATAWRGRVELPSAAALAAAGDDLIPVATIPGGAMAIREWKGLDISGYDRMILKVKTSQAGPLALRLIQTDDGVPDGFTVYREIGEGEQEIMIHLAIQPEGDLIPSTVAPVTGVWDPKEDSVLTVAFIALPGAFEIYSIHLANTPRTQEK